MEKFKKKKKLGSYPFASVIFSITVALCAIGLFGMLLIFSNELSQSIRGNVQMQIFLDKAVAETERIKIQKQIAEKEFVKIEDDKPLLEFISKEKAAEIFVKETGEDFTEFLGDNPLRDAFTIVVSPQFQHVDSLLKVKQQLLSIRGIYEVTYVEDLVNSVNSNLGKIGFVILATAIILVFAIVVLINNTIKLALFSQRFLIRSMQLVGAKANFIIWPFVTRSFFHGVLSAIFASAVLGGLLYYLVDRIPDLMILINPDLFLVLFLFLVISGVLIAMLSTYGAVNKYLKLSLDELY